jgi:site-specific DNA-methyltransferase (adenine-specific)
MKRLKLDDRAVLVQGDCFEVYPRLPQVDFIFTDPPYGHDNNSESDLISRREFALKGQQPQVPEERPIQNDDFESANCLFTDSIPWWKKILKPGAYVCCCCGGGGGAKGIQFARWSLQLEEALEFEQAIVWDKGPIGMGWHYRRSYEMVLVAKQPGAKPFWYNDSGQIENIIRPGDYGIHKIIPSTKQHPTEKCPELAAHFIRLHTKPGDTVLDPFMGSGSTGVAALQLDRKFIGVDLDPQWSTYAVERLRYVLKHRYDLAPAKKRQARTTVQLKSPGLWGKERL